MIASKNNWQLFIAVSVCTAQRWRWIRNVQMTLRQKSVWKPTLNSRAAKPCQNISTEIAIALKTWHRHYATHFALARSFTIFISRTLSVPVSAFLFFLYIFFFFVVTNVNCYFSHFIHTSHICLKRTHANTHNRAFCQLLVCLLLISGQMIYLAKIDFNDMF